MTRLIDNIDPETIMRVGIIICILGFFFAMLGLLIALCGVMLGDFL